MCCLFFGSCKYLDVIRQVFTYFLQVLKTQLPLYNKNLPPLIQVKITITAFVKYYYFYQLLEVIKKI